MMKLAAFFIVVSVIGATNGYQFRPRIDFDRTQEAFIGKLEVKATLIENELAMLADQFVAKANNTENDITSAIEAFKSKLNFLSGFFEDVVATFPKKENLELSEDICNVQGVRNYVSPISNMTHDCAVTLFRQAKEQLNGIYRNGSLFREALQQGEEKIRKCQNIDTKDAINKAPERYIQCIGDEYSSLENTLDSFNKILQNINKTVHGIPTAATILKKCEAESSTTIFMEKIQDVTTCLSKNVFGVEDAVKEGIPKTELEAILYITEKKVNIAQKLNEIALEYIKFVDKIEGKINNQLRLYKEKLTSLTGYFEDTIKKYTKFNLTQNTCGILSFQRYTLDLYDSIHNCTSDVAETLRNAMHNFLTETASIWQEFKKGKENIKNCKYKVTSEQLEKCIQKEVEEAEQRMTIFTNNVFTMRILMQPPEVSVVLVKCMAQTSTLTLTKNVKDIVKCLGQHVVPDLKKLSEFTYDLTQIIGDRVNIAIDNYANNITNFFKYIEEIIVPAVSNWMFETKQKKNANIG